MAKTEIPVNLGTLSHMAQGAELWNCTQVPSDSGDAEVQIASIPTVRRYLDANGEDMYGYMHAGYDSLIDCRQVFNWLVILGETATGEGTDAGVKRMVKAIKVSGDGAGRSSEIRFVPYIEKNSGTTAPFKTFDFIDKNAVKWVIILTYHSSQGQAGQVPGMPDGIRAFAFRADSDFQTVKEWVKETPEKVNVDGTVTPSVTAPSKPIAEAVRFAVNRYDSPLVAPIDFVYADRADALYDIFIRSQFYEVFENLDPEAYDPEGTLNVASVMPLLNNSTGTFGYFNLGHKLRSLAGVVPAVNYVPTISVDFNNYLFNKTGHVQEYIDPQLCITPGDGNAVRFTGAASVQMTENTVPLSPEYSGSNLTRFRYLGGSTFWYEMNTYIRFSDQTVQYFSFLSPNEKSLFISTVLSLYRNNNFNPSLSQMMSALYQRVFVGNYENLIRTAFGNFGGNGAAAGFDFAGKLRIISNRTVANSAYNTWYLYFFGEIFNYIRSLSLPNSLILRPNNLFLDNTRMALNTNKINALINNISSGDIIQNINTESEYILPYVMTHFAGCVAKSLWNSNKQPISLLLGYSTLSTGNADATYDWNDINNNIIDAWINGKTLSTYPASVTRAANGQITATTNFLNGVASSAYPLNYAKGIPLNSNITLSQINDTVGGNLYMNSNRIGNNARQYIITGAPSNVEAWWEQIIGQQGTGTTIGSVYGSRPVAATIFSPMAEWYNYIINCISEISTATATGIQLVRTNIKSLYTSLTTGELAENDAPEIDKIRDAVVELWNALRIQNIFIWKNQNYALQQPNAIFNLLLNEFNAFVANNDVSGILNLALMPSSDRDINMPSAITPENERGLYNGAVIGRFYKFAKFIITDYLCRAPNINAGMDFNTTPNYAATWPSANSSGTIADIEAEIDRVLAGSDTYQINQVLGMTPKFFPASLRQFESIFPLQIAFEWINRKVSILRDLIKNYRSDVPFYDVDSLSHRLLFVAGDDRFYYSGAGGRVCSELNFYTPEYSNSSSTSVNVLGNRIVLGTSNSLEFWDITNNSNDPFSPAYASNVYNMQMLQWSECKFDDKLYFLARPNEGTNYSYYCVDKTGRMEKISYPNLDAWTSRYIKVSLATYDPPAFNQNRYLKATAFQYESCPFICWQFNNPAMEQTSTNEEIIGQCLCYNALFKTWFTLPTMLFRANLESGLSEHPLVFFERFTNRIGTLTNYIDVDDKLIYSYFTIPNSNFKEYITEKNRHKSLARISVDLDLHNRSVINQRNAQMAPIDTLKPVPPAVGGHTDQKADVWSTSGPYYRDDAKIGPLQEWNTPFPVDDPWALVLAPAGAYQSIKHRLRSVKKMPYETTREIALAPMQGERNVIYSIEGLSESVDVSLRTEWNGYTRFNGFFYELE